MRKYAIGILVALVVVIGAASAWMARQVETAAPTENAFTNTRDIPSPLLGKAAPDFELGLAGGGKASLSDYQGKTVLISFWSSF